MAMQTAALERFGLTAAQTKVYLAMLRLGPCRPSNLSDSITIARPEAYRVLRELASKGLVTQNLGKPLTFAAVPPATALPMLLRQMKEKLSELDEEKSALIESLSASQSSPNETPDQQLSVIVGGYNVNVKLKQMLADAEEEYLTVVSRFALRRYAIEGMESAVIAARRRGIRIRVITEIDPTNIERARSLSRQLPIHRSQGILFYMGIVDGKEIVLGPAFGIEEIDSWNARRLDICTRNATFVQGMRALFDRFWEASLPYGKPNVRAHTRA